VNSLIIGIGVNVNQQALPAELADRAISLRMASGRMHSRIECLAAFLEEFETLLAHFEQTGPAAIINSWTRHSSFAYGRRLQVNDGFRMIEGVTRGLNGSGAIRIETGNGVIEEVYSGDVVAWS